MTASDAVRVHIYPMPQDCIILIRDGDRGSGNELGRFTYDLPRSDYRYLVAFLAPALCMPWSSAGAPIFQWDDVRYLLAGNEADADDAAA